MNKFVLMLVVAVVLTACSRAEDVLENIGDVSVPDQLTGCVVRGDDGACDKAVCVADEESDCKDWARACEKHDHMAGEQEGHMTCERREESSET